MGDIGQLLDGEVMQKNVLVIGGGISGLALRHYLRTLPTTLPGNSKESQFVNFFVAYQSHTVREGL